MSRSRCVSGRLPALLPDDLDHPEARDHPGFGERVDRSPLVGVPFERERRSEEDTDDTVMACVTADRAPVAIDDERFYVRYIGDGLVVHLELLTFSGEEHIKSDHRQFRASEGDGTESAGPAGPHVAKATFGTLDVPKVAFATPETRIATHDHCGQVRAGGTVVLRKPLSQR